MEGEIFYRGVGTSRDPLDTYHFEKLSAFLTFTTSI